MGEYAGSTPAHHDLNLNSKNMNHLLEDKLTALNQEKRRILKATVKSIRLIKRNHNPMSLYHAHCQRIATARRQLLLSQP